MMTVHPTIVMVSIIITLRLSLGSEVGMHPTIGRMIRGILMTNSGVGHIIPPIILAGGTRRTIRTFIMGGMDHRPAGLPDTGRQDRADTRGPKEVQGVELQRTAGGALIIRCRWERGMGHPVAEQPPHP
jgi:hypothetical protein